MLITVLESENEGAERSIGMMSLVVRINPEIKSQAETFFMVFPAKADASAVASASAF